MSAAVTLVTGSRKGLGKFLAEHFVTRGHQVVGCSREPAGWTLEGYHHVVADVADERQVRALVAGIRQRFGRLDHLVNNAGIAAMNHLMLTPTATVRRIFDTNCVGAFTVTREAARLMSVRKFGRVVNLSSVAVPMNLEGEAAYAMSKGAVEKLTRVAARELADFGITVNAVGPAPIRTDLIRSVPESKIAALLERQAFRRFAEYDDVANVVDFFFRPESGLVTGQVLYLGGIG